MNYTTEDIKARLEKAPKGPWNQGRYSTDAGECEFIAHSKSIVQFLLDKLTDAKSAAEFNAATYFNMAKEIRDLELRAQAARNALINVDSRFSEEVVDEEIEAEYQRLKSLRNEDGTAK